MGEDYPGSGHRRQHDATLCLPSRVQRSRHSACTPNRGRRPRAVSSSAVRPRRRSRRSGRTTTGCRAWPRPRRWSRDRPAFRGSTWRRAGGRRGDCPGRGRAIVLVGEGGEGNDDCFGREESRRRHDLEPTIAFPTQPDVAQDQLIRLDRERLLGLVERCDACHASPVDLEEFGEGVADVQLIFDDEDVAGHGEKARGREDEREPREGLTRDAWGAVPSGRRREWTDDA